MAFKLLKDKYQVETAHALLNNSLTVKVGDVIVPLSVIDTTDIVTNATGAVNGATKRTLGVVVGFCKENGEVINGGSNPLPTPAQLVTAADNTTVDKYHAMYIPVSSEMEFEGTLDAAAGTTAGSDVKNVIFALATANLIDESSVVPFDDASAPLQVYSLGLVEGSTTKIVCKFQRPALG